MICSYTKNNGVMCKAHAMHNSQYCYRHNPTISKNEKILASKRGGENRAITMYEVLPPLEVTSPQGVVALLADTVYQVRGGNMDIRVANCLGILSGQLLKALEMTEMEKRLETLEKKINEPERLPTPIYGGLSKSTLT